jgi:hypothetical protein
MLSSLLEGQGGVIKKTVDMDRSEHTLTPMDRLHHAQTRCTVEATAAFVWILLICVMLVTDVGG